METKLPDPPVPPAELTAPEAPVNLGNEAPAPAGPTPEQIDRAASTAARFSGEFLNMGLGRRGWTPLTPEEQVGWKKVWLEEMQARPWLVGVADKVPPELAILMFVYGVVGTRRDFEAKLEAEKRADEERRS